MTPTIPGPRASIRAVIALGAALGAGCTVGPDYAPPQTKAKESWSSPLEGGTSAAAPEQLTHWWMTLNDPALSSLVQRAVEGNLDLRIARARVLQARAQVGIVSGDAGPQVDAGASYSRIRQSEAVKIGGVSPAAAESTAGHDLYQVGFDASWELDLFGQIRRGVQAAEADLDAAAESQRDTLVTLVSDVARNYIDVRAFQRRLEIARQNAKIQSEAVDLATARSKAGVGTDLDVARAQAQLASTQAQIPSLEAGQAQSMHRLGVLIGLDPGSLKDELASATPIPVAPEQIPIGLPSDLLRRRPDIRRAERQAAAASARIGVARADLFPKVSLTGAIGLESTQFGTLPSGNARYWSIGPSLTWSILSAGRIRSNIRLEEARQDEALAVYDRTVLGAFEDTENALTGYGRELVRRQSLTQAVSSSTQAVTMSTELYRQGLTDFLSVIDSERQLYQSQDELAISEQSVAVDLVAIYKALGGGWDEEPAPTPGG
jgi:NodT family efflux transporter outer membrane factor (OMF) lipoprotein